MSQSPTKHLLTSVVALCLVLVVAEGWLLQQSRLASARTLLALEQKKQERDWLVRQSPALSGENETALTADVAAAGRMLTELRTALQGKDGSLFAPPPPAKSIDAFFELANFVEKLRTRAAQAQVVLKPDERFGFAAHTHEGPVAEQIVAVHRQRLATQFLVETLLESHPLALLAVRRELPTADGARDQRNRVDDFFELDRALSLRQAGQVETAAFRLEFTGQTAALRNFLNSLAGFRQPVVVRSVEVEPLAAATAATPVAPGSPVPLVRQSLSKFAVTVEFVLLADNPVSTVP
jgi:hypothetical protein